MYGKKAKILHNKALGILFHVQSASLLDFEHKSFFKRKNIVTHCNNPLSVCKNSAKFEFVHAQLKSILSLSFSLSPSLSLSLGHNVLYGGVFLPHTSKINHLYIRYNQLQVNMLLIVCIPEYCNIDIIKVLKY